MTLRVDLVIPTTRRRELDRLLGRLSGFPGRILTVDGTGRSPSAARNEGWRRSDAEWIAFLDDDVVPEEGWVEALLRDLESAETQVAGSQGRVSVPLPGDRAPTDWERCVQGLQLAQWATADMAYRRRVLEELGGFDERFPRAYREDSDLALRALRAGYRLVRGERSVVHPVGEASPLVSVRRQAGNEDDVLMRCKHGRDWRQACGAPRGRLRRHIAVSATLVGATTAARAGRRKTALALGAVWALGTAELARARIAPGPRSAGEVATMTATSVVLPLAATVHAARGWWKYARLLGASRRTRAVLFDRDGTLVEDVPYNADAARVRLAPGARQALARVRAAGLPVAVVTNQSGVGRGLLDLTGVRAVNARIEELVGSIDAWLVCPHAPDEGCTCRKPRPGLVEQAARKLGVSPTRCVVVGDIGADVGAATAAGARSVLVPTPRTRREEVEAAPVVAPDLARAVELILGGAA